MVGGPAIQPVRGLPRTPGSIITALRGIRPALVDCYRWARFRRPALGLVPLHVAMRLDEEGVPSFVGLQPPEPAPDGGVRACLREMLGTLSVDLYTPRVTDVTFALRLEPSGQGRPAHALARPRRPARATVDPARRCRASAAPVMDLLDLEAQEIDDFSEEQARAERREKVRRDRREWIRGGKVGPEPVDVPDVIAGCANVRGAFTPAALTRAVAANAGAYGACFAAANRQVVEGGSPARVDVAVEVRGDGRFCSAHVASQVDSRLARCLETAIEDVWLPAALGGRSIHAMVPLMRGTPAPTATAPAVAGCAQRVAEFQRRLDGSPWLTNPGLFAVADGIGADAAHAPHTADRDGCRQRARKLLTGAVIELHKDAQTLGNQDVWPMVIAGYDWLVAQRPPLPDDVALRFYRAEALWIMRRWTDAARAYTDVRERDPQGRFAKNAAYAAVLAWSNAIDGDEETCCAPALPGRRPPPGEAARNGLVSAIDAYLRLAPDAPEREPLIRRKADLFAR